MDLAFRLALATFCIVAPSLLFVGLCRGLDRLRADPFVDRVLARTDGATPARAAGPVAALTGGSLAPSTSRKATCRDCGAPNPTYASYCAACLGRLDD